MSTLNNKKRSSLPVGTVVDGRRMGGVVMRWIAGLVAMVALQAQAATVNLTNMGFNSLSGGLMEIRMDFDGTPPEPKGYTIEQPARIALDLDGVSSQVKDHKKTVDVGNTRSVNILESEGRTRVVVNLVQLTPYKSRIEGNSLIVTIGNDGSKDFLTQPKPAMGNSFAENRPAAAGRGAAASSIEDIDFQRGAKGEGQLVINLSNPKADIDVVSEGNQIRVRFLRTQLPENLRRRFDVVDFATPVQFFDVSEVDGAAVVSIKPSTNDFDYLAYQTDNKYVVSLKPLTPAEVEAKKAEFAYVGDKISLNFQDIDVRNVLQLVAEFTGMNLVASDTVGGKITLRLEEVPWDQALELILKTKGLDKRQVGNVLLVAPAAEIAEREKQELETRKQIQELAPLQTEFIHIKYASADDIYKLFATTGGEKAKEDATGSTAKFLSSRGSVVVDARTNSLLISETADRLEAIHRLINLIDVPVRQVMVEARIVIANSDYLEDLGIRWGGNQINHQPVWVANPSTTSAAQVPYVCARNCDGKPTTVFTGRSSQATTNMSDISMASSTGKNSTSISFPDAYVVDLAATEATATRFAVGYLSDRFYLTAELSALESQGRGEVVSQPKVITGDKQKAVIKSGQQVPYLSSSSSGRTTVSFKEAVLKLEVTPNITPDGRILLTLVLNQDSVGGSIAGEFNSQVPLIDTNSIETQVMVDNGQTIVLGGVYKTNDVENESKTPFLGDIPYLGRLFKKTYKETKKQELLMFITPRIIADTLLD